MGRGYPKPRQSARYRVLHGVRSEQRGFEIDGQPSLCWIWLGELDKNGYGRIKDKGRRVPAHWVLKGAPPEGLEIDHLCKQRACVRPEHLEYVTHAENNRRKYVSNED